MLLVFAAVVAGFIAMPGPSNRPHRRPRPGGGTGGRGGERVRMRHRHDCVRGGDRRRAVRADRVLGHGAGPRSPVRAGPSAGGLLIQIT